MAATPQFTTTPNVGFARLTAANTTSDGSGTIATVFTTPSTGSRVDRVTFTNSQATAAASSAMVGKVFISDTAGANYRMYQEVVIVTITRSTTVIGARNQITFPGGLILKSGQLIGVTQSVYASAADQQDVVAEGGDF